MGSLPKTRPQRRSARRGAASNGASKAVQKPARKAPKKPAQRRPTKRKPAKVEPERAPRQGFEAESELELGKPVQPPGSSELAASVAELLGELAQSGLTSGGRLLKDALSRLSR